jgi:hypothetical protein
VRERTIGLLLIFGTAVITGVFFGARDGAKQDHEERLAAAPNASAELDAIPAPHPASKDEIRATVSRLEGAVRAGAADAKNPWALAHGLIAFGPDFVASDGTKAVDAIARHAEERELAGGKLWLFPAKAGSEPVEPHRFLMVKTLLDVGVPLGRKLVTSTGTVLTLARLVADMHRAATLPSSDADYHQIAWLTSALALEKDLDPKTAAAAPGPKLAELEKLVLTRLETDQRVIGNYAGPVERAFDQGSPLHLAKRDKTGIYGHSCGGLHLVQAALSSVAAVGDEADRRRASKQLGLLIYRYELERTAYASLLARHPDQGLLIRVQQLKFFGHLVETLTLAEKLGLTSPDSEGGRKIAATLRTAAGDVAQVVKELDDGGVYDRLAAIRKDREQTYLDLIGDGCHALRGLRRLLDS